MEIIDVKNSQNIILHGCLFDAKERSMCVIFVPGMAGNIIENKFIQVLGEEFQKQNIGFVCAHNQGSFHIVDYPYVDHENYPRRGVAFEKFDDCIFDISAYIEYAQKLGYKKIVLAGHSLGANKVIHYLSKQKPANVVAYILLSPPDIAYEIDTTKNMDKLLAEAKANINSGKPDKLLNELVWDYYILSSARFVDLVENKNAKNLPIMSKNGSFDALKSIKLPLLAIAGEHDDSCSNNIKRYLDSLIKNSNFAGEYAIVCGAGHTYYGKEQALFDAIYPFVLKFK